MWFAKDESLRPGGRRGPGLAAKGARAVLAVLLLSSFTPSGATASVDEDEVKAAFLLNFTRFVDWPESAFAAASSPFVICVLNDSGFARTAAGVIGDRTVGDRPVRVRDTTNAQDANACHILFVPASQGGMHQTVIATLSADSVFTVSDSDGFAEMGGVANFKRAGSKLGLEINRAAAARAQLKVSARLLRIADVVG